MSSEDSEGEFMYPLKIGIALSDAALWQEVQAELSALPVNVVFEAASVDDMASFLEKVEKYGPEALLLDPTMLPVSFAEFMRDLGTVGRRCDVVVLRRQPSPEDILTALRAGAKEYLYSPLGAAFREALERIARSFESAPASPQSNNRRGRIIGFLSVKGGCGATTLACHTALDIASRNDQETLLADLDFHAGLIRILMQSKSRYSILDAANNLQRLDTSYWRGLVSNGHQGIEVIAATPVEIPQRIPADRELRRVLHFIRSQYEWTVADLGRGLDSLALGVIEELDLLVLVVTLEVPVLQLAKLALRYLNEAGVPADKVRVVLNRVSKRAGITPEDVEGVLAKQLCCSIPNDYGALENAYAHGRLLPEGHRLRSAIAGLTTRLTGLETARPKKKFSLFGL